MRVVLKRSCAAGREGDDILVRKIIPHGGHTEDPLQFVVDDVHGGAVNVRSGLCEAVDNGHYIIFHSGRDDSDPDVACINSGSGVLSALVRILGEGRRASIFELGRNGNKTLLSLSDYGDRPESLTDESHPGFLFSEAGETEPAMFLVGRYRADGSAEYEFRIEYADVDAVGPLKLRVSILQDALCALTEDRDILGWIGEYTAAQGEAPSPEALSQGLRSFGYRDVDEITGRTAPGASGSLSSVLTALSVCGVAHGINRTTPSGCRVLRITTPALGHYYVDLMFDAVGNPIPALPD